jgi:hypothetical protein
MYPSGLEVDDGGDDGGDDVWWIVLPFFPSFLSLLLGLSWDGSVCLFPSIYFFLSFSLRASGGRGPREFCI